MDGEIFYATQLGGTKTYGNLEIKKANPGGFRSRESESEKKTIDLNEHLICNRANTYFMKVSGDAMVGAGIYHGDMVIVDRSLKVSNGRVIIAVLNGEMLIRRFEKNYNKIRLIPDTNRLSPIDVDPSGADFSIWGVVTYVIHSI
jgi:DNA polymerase V